MERDNGGYEDEDTKIKLYKRPEVSPLAVVDRSQPNSMLGGDFAFKELIKKAEELKI